MEVHLHHRRRADDDERLAARAEHIAERMRVDGRVVEDEFRTEAMFTDVLAPREDRRAHRTPRKRGGPHRRPRHEPQRALEKIHKAGPTRVDHSGFFELRQLFGRPIERVVRRSQHGGCQTVEIGLANREAIGLLGGGTRDRDDRPFDGLRQSGPRGCDGVLHRDRELKGIDRLAVAHVMGEAAQHLRENHPRVAPRAEQATACGGFRHDVKRLPPDPMRLA
jgi:hypothetical protein